MFSAIPMPRFEWKEEDGSYSLIFFPFVGVITGALILLVNSAPVSNVLPVAVRIMLTLAVPLIVSGGIHLDGFMDTEDALKSNQAVERKLEILKDPRTGAFAVISLVKYFLVYALAVTAVLLSPKTGTGTVVVLCLTFVMSRCCSALTSVCFRKAKTDGMLYELTSGARTSVIAVVATELAVVSSVAFYFDVKSAAAVVGTLAAFTVFYRHKAYKEFGGVTGDTAGWFLTVSEILCALFIAVTLYVP